MIPCQRCGKCCVLPSGKDCRWLVRMNSGKTLCRIYRSRLGKDIGEGCVCLDDRNREGWNYNDCERFKDV
jgi:hypothetical protein